MIEITAERLRELLHYDPETGVFTRRVSTNNAYRVGDIAGGINSQGYLQIRLDKRLYKAHRLAWLYVHGELPPADVDHINGIKNDNRLGNLRPATRSQNQANMRKHDANTSGYKGVSWNQQHRKWRANIRVNGRLKYLGAFDGPAEAHAAYLRAAEGGFGEFARSE
jgi:hypothetical protein